MPLIAEAERLLASAASQQRAGRFQLEAAIQSAHVERARCAQVDWQAIARLYEGLVRTAPPRWPRRVAPLPGSRCWTTSAPKVCRPISRTGRCGRIACGNLDAGPQRLTRAIAPSL
jgi:hypothetical protein